MSNIQFMICVDCGRNRVFHPDTSGEWPDECNAEGKKDSLAEVSQFLLSSEATGSEPGSSLPSGQLGKRKLP